MSVAEARAAPAAEASWEDSKENFQPLRAGRKPAALRDPDAELQAKDIEETRSRFWKEIAEYRGDDPLEVWLRFIKWTQETFKAGGHKAELLPLLERCTRELQRVESYKDDIRFLRVWIQYADCLPDPTDVFAFLKANEVGTGHALFYIAYATALEWRGAYARADGVYQQGLNRLAAPADRLRTKFVEFQARMARRIQRQASEQAAGGGGLEDAAHPERRALAALAGRRGARTGGGLGGGKRKAAATPPRAGKHGNASLNIFVDEEFAGGENAGVPGDAAGLALLSAPSGPWDSLASFEQTRKENVQRAGVWAGQRARQRAGLAPAAAPALDIPVDPEFELQAAAPSAAQADRHDGKSLRRRLDAGPRGPAPDAEELLRLDPLRLHRAGAPLPAAGGTAAPPTKREEVPGFDAAALVGANGEELAFEELRALRWQPPPADSQCGSHAAPAEQAAPGDVQPAAAVDCAAGPLPTPFDQPAPMDAAPAVPDAPPAPAAGALSAPSPVAALRDAPSGFAEPTVTISTRAAFEAINRMFQGSLPNDRLALPPTAAPARSPLPEVTATLSTRSALEAASRVFAEPGGGCRAPAPRPPCAAASPPGGAPASRRVLVRRDTELRSAGSPGSTPGGLCIREDTQFVSLAGPGPTPHSSPAGGFCIREDTQFVSVAALGGGPGPTPRSSPAGGLCVREDTQFVSVAAALGSAGLASPPPACQLGKWGFAPGADDTLALPTGVGELSSGLEGLRLAAGASSGDEGGAGDEENALGVGRPARDVRDPGTAAAALQPVLGSRLGGPLLDEAGAEAACSALAAQGTFEGDDFVVPPDEGLASRAAAPAGASPAAQPAADPFEPGFHDSCLAMLDPPPRQWPGVEELSASDEEAVVAALQGARRRGRAGSVRLGGRQLSVQRVLGSGAYATVFRAAAAGEGAVALKWQAPPCPWEWYMCRVVQGRVAPGDARLFACPPSLALGRSCSLLVLPLAPLGSLLDLLNARLKQGRVLDEAAALHLACDLLRMLGALREARVLHADIKPDNLLLQAEPGGLPRLQLIDFGRGVDLELLPPGAVLQGDSGTQGFRCPEMMEGRPWLWQADGYAAAGVAHCLLFGDYMEVERVADAQGELSLRLRRPYRRYWATDLWADFFGLLLNQGAASGAEQLRALQRRFEAHLAPGGEPDRRLRAELPKLVARLGGSRW